ncbi:MAG: hypothetical protein J5999_11810 [Oscillospiraceae bacterium]|nr:hypothetical protein [Oscillospiraceae bacterium]
MRKFSKWLSAAAVMLLAVIMSAVTAAAADDDICLFEGEGKSNGSWGQAYNLNIRSDEKYAQLILMLNESSKVYVDFELEGTPAANTQGLTFILQKWEKEGGDQIWAQTPPTDITDGVAAFDYASMVDTYGSDDLSTVDQIYVGDTGAVLKVTKVVFDINGDGINGDTVEIPEIKSEDKAEETSAPDDDKEEETTSQKADDKDKAEENEEESSSGGINVVLIVVIAVVVIAAVVVVLVLKNRKKYY